MNDVIIETHDLNIFYGDFKAVTDVNMQIPQKRITSIIGPSGCGKSTLLRAFNRMNELVPSSHIEGEIIFDGKNLYDRDVDPVQVRYRIGMVFQRPNPFPKSIYENVAWAARIHGYKGSLDELVETTLKKAALWDEVKDILKQSALSLSGGQQQRLCVARALAIQAAQEKAQALAGELGKGVGEPTMIQEVQNSWWSGYSSWWGSRWGSGMTQNVIQEVGAGALTGDGSLAPGQISITARVMSAPSGL